MSRIGNSPITVPEKVEITVSDKNLVTVKGPKGELKEQLSPKSQLKTKTELSFSKEVQTRRTKELFTAYQERL